MNQDQINETRRLYRAAFGQSWPHNDDYLLELWQETATQPPARGIHFAGRRGNVILLMRESHVIREINNA